MSEQPEKYYTLTEAIEAGVDYYDDEDGILQRVDERIDENGVDNNCSEMQVVVLNDGETYTGLKGSKILTIPTDIDENDVDTYVKDNYKDGVDIQ